MSDDLLVRVTLQVQNDKALQRVTAELDKATKALKSTQKAAKDTGAATARASKAMGNVGNSAKKMSGNVRNASYQITDFIVQVQGGTKATVAMGQQLPQLLAGFGALGAALGVVAAIMPAVIQAFAGAATATKSFSQSVDALNEDMSSLTDIASEINFTSWADSFIKLDETGKSLAKTILDIRIQLQEIKFQEAFENFTSFANNMLPAGRLLDAQMSSMADNMGITIGNLERLVELTKGSEQSILGDPEVMQEVVDILGTAGDKGAVYLENLQKLIAARKSLDTGRAASADPGSFTTPDRSSSAGGKDPAAESIRQRAAAYRDLYPEAVKYFEAVQMANQQREYGLISQEQWVVRTDQLANNYYKAGEAAQFAAAATEKMTTANNDLAEQQTFTQQAFEIFDQTFQTAINGMIQGTQSLSDAFKNLSKGIIAELLKIAAYKSIAGFMGGSFGGQTAWSFAADGGVFEGGVQKFAKGGIVSSPTMFPMKNGMGLMGEGSGPEAIIPLSRGSDGKLGVSGAGMNVTVNNMAPGVSVQPRQTESGLTVDVVMNTLANQIRRGGNDFANAFEDSYSLGRGGGVY